MSLISYDTCDIPVRDNLVEAHRAYWKRLASPGTWLTGSQRIAVAQEVRQAANCSLCGERKEALSPYQVDGVHDSHGDLPEVMIEVVHRVVTDASRLTKTWLEGNLGNGLSVEQYVEIVGTVVNVFSIDEFCRGLGISPHPLPEPREGEPSGYRPDNVLDDGGGAWVPILPPIVDIGPDSDLWQGRTGYVIRALSLVPDEVRHMLDLLRVHYLNNNDIWDMKSSPHGNLSRVQTEVIASRVSALNNCFY